MAEKSSSEENVVAKVDEDQGPVQSIEEVVNIDVNCLELVSKLMRTRFSVLIPYFCWF